MMEKEQHCKHNKHNNIQIRLNKTKMKIRKYN